MAISQSKTIIKAVVPKTTADALRRFATITGKSLSTVVAEFLVEAEPAIRRLSGMIEVAKQQQTMFPKATVAELEAALDDLSGNAVEVMDRVQNALQLPLEAPGQGPARPRARKRSARASGRPRKRKNPRPVTRG